LTFPFIACLSYRASRPLCCCTTPKPPPPFPPSLAAAHRRQAGSLRQQSPVSLCRTTFLNLYFFLSLKRPLDLEPNPLFDAIVPCRIVFLPRPAVFVDSRAPSIIPSCTTPFLRCYGSFLSFLFVFHSSAFDRKCCYHSTNRHIIPSHSINQPTTTTIIITTCSFFSLFLLLSSTGPPSRRRHSQS